jgi:hypothetical protein
MLSFSKLKRVLNMVGAYEIDDLKSSQVVFLFKIEDSAR